MRKKWRLIAAPARAMALSILVLLATCGTAGGNAGGGADGGTGVSGGGQGGQKVSAAAATDGSGERKGWPEVLRLGVIPGEEVGKLSRGNRKLVEDLGKALGIKTELFVGEDYTAVVEAMRTRHIEIASLGPFSYIIAHERSGAIPFAVKARSKEEAFYYSQIVVPKDSPVQTVQELRGKTFLFADPASTSGHLFPRAKLIELLGISNDEIEKFFGNVSFSGGHDKSILAIAKGTADGAGVCSTCVERVIEAGLVNADDYRVIAQSDPIPTSPFTYRNDLPENLVEAIKAFFFNYHHENPDYFDDGTERFIPVEDKDYDVIRRTAEALNMSPEELLG